MKTRWTVIVLALIAISMSAAGIPADISYQSGGRVPKIETMMLYNVIVELPEGYIVKGFRIEKPEQWSITHDDRFLFVKPLAENAAGLLEIETEKLIIPIKLETVPSGTENFKTKVVVAIETPAPAVAPKTVTPPSVAEPVNVEVTSAPEQKKGTPWANIAAGEKPFVAAPVAKKEKPVKVADPDAKFASDILIGLQGGNFNSGTSKKWNITGEGIYALKYKPIGLFIQAAAKVNYNPFISEIGGSFGVGLEGKNIGFYGFVDAASYRIDEYQSTFHIQARPAIRLKLPKFSAAAYYAIGIGPGTAIDNFTEDGILYNLVNDTMNCFGFEVAGNVFSRLNLRVSGLMAEKGYYKIQGDVEYNLFSSFDLNLRFSRSAFGDLPLLGDAAFPNALALSAGISFRFGDPSVKFSDLSSRLIFKPVYPIVAQKKELPKDGGKMTVTLEATPTVGKAPLQVKFKTTLAGGRAPYVIEWYFGPAQSTVNNMEIQYEYNQVGVYNTFVKVTDATQDVAVSNVVMIRVTGENSGYTIQASADANGKIEPSGSVSVAPGGNKTFTATGDAGYVPDYLLIDQGTVEETRIQGGSYTFENVQKNHTIKAFFRAGNAQTFTITSSAGPNGTINPAGTVSVVQGNNVTFTGVPNTNYAVDYFLIDGSDRVSGNTTYTFNNVQANHTIQVFFKSSIVNYTITPSAGPNGTITPSGAVTVAQGASATFTMNPNTGYEVDVVTANGVNVTSQLVNGQYTFTNVQANGTIHVTFKIKQYRVEIVVYSGGTSTVTPWAPQTVNHGGFVDYNITYQSGLKIDHIGLVDLDTGAEYARYNINGTPASWRLSNVTRNTRVGFVFVSSMVRLEWESINGYRNYYINDVNMGPSGGMDVLPGAEIRIVYFTASGLRRIAYNVTQYEDGSPTANGGTTDNWYVVIKPGVALTKITDQSLNEFRYRPRIEQGNGNIFPNGDEWRIAGSTISVTINSTTFEKNIEYILINGNRIDIGAETYSFNLVMNEDKNVQVYFEE